MPRTLPVTLADGELSVRAGRQHRRCAICVNATVIAAATRDYRVTVVSDGVATIDDDIQQACFQIWQRKFARLRTAEEVLAELVGQ